MKVDFKPLAADNFDEARKDPPLHAAYVEALDAIEAGAPRARETALRVHGGTAWSIQVLVHGRDDVYQVIWAQLADEDHARVVYIGSALQA